MKWDADVWIKRRESSCSSDSATVYTSSPHFCELRPGDEIKVRLMMKLYHSGCWSAQGAYEIGKVMLLPIHLFWVWGQFYLSLREKQQVRQAVDISICQKGDGGEIKGNGEYQWTTVGQNGGWLQRKNEKPKLPRKVCLVFGQYTERE